MTERRVFKYGYIFCKSVFLFTLLIRLDEMLEFPSLVLATALPLILYVNNYDWPLFVINNISNFYCILKYGASLEILLYRSFRFRGGSLNLYSTEPIHRFSTDFL